MRSNISQLKINRKRKLIYITLFLFLLFMFVMTIVSRIINMHHIPIILTKHVGNGALELNLLGKGVIKFGIINDTEQMSNFTQISDEEVYYVRGYFYDKAYAETISIGAKVKLFIHGMSDYVYGIVEYKIYDYKMDNIEVIISLNEGDIYLLGSEVDFVLEKNRVRFDYIIPKDIIYEREDGSCYIYVLKERDSILGNVTIADLMDITILAENDERAAIKEEIDRNTRIIVKDDRLKDGIRVREKE